VCAVAMMIEGGDNCEEGKLAVPLLMWREVEYHILVCGLAVRCLVMGPRHGILVDWHILVNDLREVYNFCVCTTVDCLLCLRTKGHPDLGLECSGMCRLMCVHGYCGIVELNLSERFVLHLDRLCLMVLHCIVQEQWHECADGSYSDDVYHYPQQCMWLCFLEWWGHHIGTENGCSCMIAHSRLAL